MSRGRHVPEAGDEGYLLIGLVVVCFLMVLFLGVAAPRVAKQLERDREVEAEHRALEYVRAIKLYHDKTQGYPNSVEQLLGGGTQGSVTSGAGGQQHYLRQAYKDPLTGGEFRMIHLGEQKTEVKGFFGEPLEGFAQGSLGAVAGQASGIGTGLGGQSGLVGGMNGNGSTSSSGFGSSSSGATSGIGGTTSTSSTTASPVNTNTTDTSSTLGGTSATSFQGSKGQIVGVGSNKTGAGIVEWNGRANIEDWEFLYDPRVEILKQKVSIFGGTPAQSGTGSLGSMTGSASGLGSNTQSSGGGSGSSGTGSSNSGTSTTSTGTTIPQ